MSSSRNNLQLNPSTPISTVRVTRAVSTNNSIVSSITSPGGGNTTSNNHNPNNTTTSTRMSGDADSDDEVDNGAKEDEEEGGFHSDNDDALADGGDSDVEGEEFEIHQSGLRILDGSTSSTIRGNVEVEEGAGRVKDIVDLTATGGMTVIGKVTLDEYGNEVVKTVSDDISSNYDALTISKVKLPTVPDHWVEPTAVPTRNQPPNDQIDNPGNWNPFTFRPVYASRSKTAKYKHHALPTGAQPVPKDDNGKRIENGWEFFYSGWKNDNMPYRRGATTTNMFPKEMEGSLDYDLLKKLGMSKDRIVQKDALFFYQLILPICDPSKSGIADDPRIAYYSDIERFTNMSKAESGFGGTYGHSQKATSATECLKYDGVVIMDGVLGGSNGALYRRWNQESSNYSKEIATEMTATRFQELKQAIKLCHNGSVSKSGQPGYDPAYKYDLVYKAMVHNTNAITKYASENQTIDETTWGHGGYGEANSGLVARLRNKKKNKGGQTVIISDSREFFRPRAYQHRHKLHVLPTIPPLTRQGSRELYDICGLLAPMLIGTTNSNSTTKKIFRRLPVICVDNYFICDKVLDYVGGLGFGIIGTNARDVLPADISKHHLHVIKTQSNTVSKVARFNQPIVAVKNNENGSQRAHVSFQSTSSCNIATVNALNECKLFVEIRERGRKNNKRHWGIEMNHARRLYLSLYCRIDVTDHLLTNAYLHYRSWKYWHAAKNHATAMAFVAVYDVYRECCQVPEWKVENEEMMDYFTFREKLAKQQLTYSPIFQNLPGDECMRSVTSLAKTARNSNKRRKVEDAVTEKQYRANIRTRTTRLCGDLDKLCHHLGTVIKLTKPKICAWCGENAYTACGVCLDPNNKKPVVLHHNAKRGPGKDEQCFYHYHNNTRFGLGRNDSTQLLMAGKMNWKKPTASDLRQNAAHIKTFKTSGNN